MLLGCLLANFWALSKGQSCSHNTDHWILLFDFSPAGHWESCSKVSLCLALNCQLVDSNGMF